MQVYLVGWPDHSWSTLVTRRRYTLEELLEVGGPIDATDNPHAASIFQVRLKDGEFYADLPFPGSPHCIHSGALTVLQLRTPHGGGELENSLGGTQGEEVE